MFEWDEDKRQTNIVKHNFDFADAEKLFLGHSFTFEDERGYEETRFVTIGMLDIYIVVIIHTEDEDVTRIISMRLATKYERNLYSQSLE